MQGPPRQHRPIAVGQRLPRLPRRPDRREPRDAAGRADRGHSRLVGRHEALLVEVPIER